MQAAFLILLMTSSYPAPVTAQTAAPCPQQALPAPLDGAGFAPNRWPEGEVIRFSAAPSFEQEAYAIQITRQGRRGVPEMQVVKLVRQRQNNCYERGAEWRFPLSPAEADQLFGRIHALKAVWRRQLGVIVMDGTGFSFEHRRGGEVTKLDLSPAADGQTGQLSGLILNIARSFAGDGLPDRPDWRSE